MRIFVSTLLVAVVASLGCASERDLETYDEGDYQFNEQNGFLDTFGEYGNMNVDNARTYGAMGNVRDISGTAIASGYKDAEYTSVDVVVTNNSGSAMHLLSIYGDLNQLERGRAYSFNGDSWPEEAGTVYASTTNCSGPAAGEWDVDQMADNTTITIEDGAQPGETKVTYETVMTDGFFGEDRSGGEFVIQE